MNDILCVFWWLCVSMVCVWESQSVVHQYHNLQLNQLVFYEANRVDGSGGNEGEEVKEGKGRVGDGEKRETEKKMRQTDKEKTKLVLIASDDHIHCTNIRLGKVQSWLLSFCQWRESFWRSTVITECNDIFQWNNNASSKYTSVLFYTFTGNIRLPGFNLSLTSK